MSKEDSPAASPLPPPDDDAGTLAEPNDGAATGIERRRGWTGLVKRRRKRVPLEPQLLRENLDVDLSCWMRYLPDAARLDELYLPGTHQSLASRYPLVSSRCQSASLLAQLRGGIRFVDFRFALRDDGELWAYHGVVSQGRRAGEVFDEVYRWLESNEGAQECVVVSCKQENSAPHFATALWDLLDGSPRSRARWYDEDRWPALAEVRGKCLMFCRFDWDSKRGLHPPIWPNDSHAAWRTSIGGRETVVQDWYGLTTPRALPRKAALALSLFSPSMLASLTATASTPPPSAPTDLPVQSTVIPLPHRISFLSCASFPLLYPSSAAKGFGRPGLGLGWHGVNELVLAGVRALQDAGESGAGGAGRKGARGRRYEAGEGGMVLLMDFCECPPVAGAGTRRGDGRGEAAGALVRAVVEMNFL